MVVTKQDGIEGGSTHIHSPSREPKHAATCTVAEHSAETLQYTQTEPDRQRKQCSLGYSVQFHLAIK